MNPRTLRNQYQAERYNKKQQDLQRKVEPIKATRDPEAFMAAHQWIMDSKQIREKHKKFLSNIKYNQGLNLGELQRHEVAIESLISKLHHDHLVIQD